MKKNGVKVEWKIEENEPAGPLSQGEPDVITALGNEPASIAANRKEMVIATTLIVLFLLLISGWLWQRHRQSLQTTKELQTALVLDSHVFESQTPAGGKVRAGLATDLLADMLSMNALPSKVLPSKVEVADYRRIDNRIMVQATFEYRQEGEIHAYRETRFLEKRGEQWLPIAPDPMLMGPVETLKAAHFVIHFPEVDAHAVFEAAPKLEQLYATVRQDFGLPTVADSLIYTIEVISHNAPIPQSKARLLGSIIVPSPTLLSVPVEMSAGTVFYQSVVHPFALLSLDAFKANYSNQWKTSYMRWPPMEKAVALWILWEDGGPLATAQEDLVRWLYPNGQSAQAYRRHVLPDGYALLCRTYQIWELSPWEVEIPLSCSDADQQHPLPPQGNEDLRAWTEASSYPPLQTALDHRAYPPKGTGTLAETFRSTVLIETVLEYIVVTYGRDHLPLFLAALGEHDRLETLIPAVFGISTDAFEAGWQSYVVERYHVD